MVEATDGQSEKGERRNKSNEHGMPAATGDQDASGERLLASSADRQWADVEWTIWRRIV